MPPPPLRVVLILPFYHRFLRGLRGDSGLGLMLTGKGKGRRGEGGVLQGLNFSGNFSGKAPPVSRREEGAGGGGGAAVAPSLGTLGEGTTHEAMTQGVGLQRAGRGLQEQAGALREGGRGALKAREGGGGALDPDEGSGGVGIGYDGCMRMSTMH